MSEETEQIIEKHTVDKNVVSILQSIQDKYGYIPEDKSKEIAKKLNIPFVKLWGVATFYSQFKFQKPGKYIIQICNGTACHVNDSGKLIEALKESLEIEEGKTTEDGLFTIELVNCIGACARSPNVSINGRVYGFLTVEKLKEIIDNIKKNE